MCYLPNTSAECYRYTDLPDPNHQKRADTKCGVLIQRGWTDVGNEEF